MHKAEIKMMAQRAAGCGQNNMEQYEDNEQDKTDHSHEKPKMPPLFVNTEGQKPALEDVKPIRASDMDEKKAVALPVKQSIFDKMSDWWFFMDTGMKAFLIFAGVMIVVVLLIFLV